jgi:hypothetical protein
MTVPYGRILVMRSTTELSGSDRLVWKLIYNQLLCDLLRVSAVVHLETSPFRKS